MSSTQKTVLPGRPRPTPKNPLPMVSVTEADLLTSLSDDEKGPVRNRNLMATEVMISSASGETMKDFDPLFNSSNMPLCLQGIVNSSNIPVRCRNHCFKSENSVNYLLTAITASIKVSLEKKPFVYSYVTERCVIEVKSFSAKFLHEKKLQHVSLLAYELLQTVNKDDFNLAQEYIYKAAEACEIHPCEFLHTLRVYSNFVATILIDNQIRKNETIDYIKGNERFTFKKSNIHENNSQRHPKNSVELCSFQLPRRRAGFAICPYPGCGSIFVKSHKYMCGRIYLHFQEHQKSNAQNHEKREEKAETMSNLFLNIKNVEDQLKSDESNQLDDDEEWIRAKDLRNPKPGDPIPSIMRNRPDFCYYSYDWLMPNTVRAQLEIKTKDIPDEEPKSLNNPEITVPYSQPENATDVFKRYNSRRRPPSLNVSEGLRRKLQRFDWPTLANSFLVNAETTSDAMWKTKQHHAHSWLSSDAHSDSGDSMSSVDVCQTDVEFDNDILDEDEVMIVTPQLSQGPKRFSRGPPDLFSKPTISPSANEVINLLSDSD